MSIATYTDLIAWASLMPPGCELRVDRSAAMALEPGVVEPAPRTASSKARDLTAITYWCARQQAHLIIGASVIECLLRFGHASVRGRRVRVVEWCEPPLSVHAQRDPLLFGASA